MSPEHSLGSSVGCIRRPQLVGGCPPIRFARGEQAQGHVTPGGTSWPFLFPAHLSPSEGEAEDRGEREGAGGRGAGLMVPIRQEL